LRSNNGLKDIHAPVKNNIFMNFLKKLSAWCYRVTGPFVLTVSVFVFALFMALVLPAMAGVLTEVTGVEKSPDTSLVYSAADLYAMAEAYGAEGRAYYIYTRFTFDIAWPLAYLFFLAASLSYLYRPLVNKKQTWSPVNLLPFAAAFFDFLENSGASLVMYRYPAPTPFIARLTPVFTFLKWLFIGASFAALVLGVAGMIRKKFKTG